MEGTSLVNFRFAMLSNAGILQGNDVSNWDMFNNGLSNDLLYQKGGGGKGAGCELPTLVCC